MSWLLKYFEEEVLGAISGGSVLYYLDIDLPDKLPPNYNMTQAFKELSMLFSREIVGAIDKINNKKQFFDSGKRDYISQFMDLPSLDIIELEISELKSYVETLRDCSKYIDSRLLLSDINYDFDSLQDDNIPVGRGRILNESGFDETEAIVTPKKNQKRKPIGKVFWSPDKLKDCETLYIHLGTAGFIRLTSNTHANWMEIFNSNKLTTERTLIKWVRNPNQFGYLLYKLISLKFIILPEVNKYYYLAKWFGIKSEHLGQLVSQGKAGNGISKPAMEEVNSVLANLKIDK